jgi:hypothetical protein
VPTVSLNQSRFGVSFCWGPCDRTLTIGENDDNGTLLEMLADDDATALAFALEQPGVVIYFVAAGT